MSEWSANNMSYIVEFMLEQRTDIKGRMLSDIWKYDKWQQEYIHDYIQWLFPVDKRERYEKNKPIVTEQDQNIFDSSDRLKTNMLISLDFMLDFWGIARNGKHFNIKGKLDKKTNYWIKINDHNQMRISRVIRSLALCGQKELAKEFQSFVIKTGKEYKINEKTISIWENIIIDLV